MVLKNTKIQIFVFWGHRALIISNTIKVWQQHIIIAVSKGSGMRKWGAHLVQSGVVQLDPTFGFSPRPISRVYFKWKADMASGLMGVPTIWYILPHIYLYTLALLIHTTFTIILHSSFQSLLLIYSDEHKRAKVGFTNHHEKKTRWDEFVFEICVCGSPDVKRFCCS